MESQSGHCMSLWFWLVSLITNPACSVVVPVMTEEKMWSVQPMTLWLRDQGVVHKMSCMLEPPLLPMTETEFLGQGSGILLSKFLSYYDTFDSCTDWGTTTVLGTEGQKEMLSRGGKAAERKLNPAQLGSWCFYRAQTAFQAVSALLMSLHPFSLSLVDHLTFETREETEAFRGYCCNFSSDLKKKSMCI